MIYLDNSATSGFKPSVVTEKIVSCNKYLNANAGRSGHKLSVKAQEEVFLTRQKINEFFNNDSVERVVFTSNCTQALNMAILGTVKKGGNVVTTVTEHNSVLRPLYHLQKLGLITLTIVEPKGEFITSSDIENNLKEDTYLVIVNAISNVNGAENDITSVGKLCKEKKITFMVDGAQMAGHKKIDMLNSNINILAVAGHKGLLATQGVGVLIFNSSVEIAPTTFGGTGSDSFNTEMPSFYPERLECGTLNLPSICALKESVILLESKLNFVTERLLELSKYAIDMLEKIPNIQVYSKPNCAGIVAIRHLKINSLELADLLSEKFDIATRGGYHCAPLMHKFLKTDEFGLVRISTSQSNTKKEIDFLADSLIVINNGI